MNIGAIADTMIADYYNSKPKQSGVDFKQAVEDYMDEALTGLTKEEREAINAILKKYTDEHPGDITGYKNLFKDLLKKFGFKGDIEEYVDPVSKGDMGEVKALKQGQTPVEAAGKSTTEKVTDSEGNTYIVIKMNNGLSFKMKVAAPSEEGQSTDEGSGERSKWDSITESYEKNSIFL